jgi:hypothetical protein
VTQYILRAEPDRRGALLTYTGGGGSSFYSPAIQPVGWTELSARGWNDLAANEFDSAGAEGWSAAGEGQASNLSIVSDATAPTSPNNVMRTTYPTGFADGRSPCFPGPQLISPFSGGYKGLYYRAVVKPSSGFQGQASITKLGFMWCGDGGAGSGTNRFFFRLAGVGTVNPLSLALNVQGGFGDARSWSRNVGSAGDDEVVRGEWNLIEWRVQFESAIGQSDAIVRAAVNGVQIIEVTNERFLDPGEGAFTWTMLTLDRTWGGEDGETVGTEFYYDEDHTVVLGTT